MKNLKIKKSTIIAASKAAKLTPENFVSRIRSISLGRRVCAHLISETPDGYMVFRCP